MTVLALVSEKGGGGKTTVAVHLAAEWHRQGLQVLLADCDPQESASTWADLAESLGHPAPPVVSLGDSLGKQVRDLAPKYDVVLLDTPGHRSDRMARALAVADLVVVPVRSGQQDLWSLARTVEAVKLANDAREAQNIKPCAAVLVPNATTRTTLTKDAKAKLRGLGLPLLERGLGDRVAFSRAFANGLGVSVFEPGGVATLELRELAQTLAEILELPAVVQEVRDAG